jgi:hypothetical protein
MRASPSSIDTPSLAAAPVPRSGRAAAPGPFAASGPEARRLAAAILEVLAGMQTPSEAARALGLSLARYYQLEGRALAGLVAACESRRCGRGRAPGSELAELRRECDRLRRECARQQALVRVARRTASLGEPPAAPSPPAETRPRRRRRPKARALKMAAQLRAEDGPAPQAAALAGTATPPAEAPGGP